MNSSGRGAVGRSFHPHWCHPHFRVGDQGPVTNVKPDAAVGGRKSTRISSARPAHDFDQHCYFITMARSCRVFAARRQISVTCLKPFAVPQASRSRRVASGTASPAEPFPSAFQHPYVFLLCATSSYIPMVMKYPAQTGRARQPPLWCHVWRRSSAFNLPSPAFNLHKSEYLKFLHKPKSQKS